MTEIAILQQAKECKAQPTLKPFSPLVIDFLQTLSLRLLQQRDKPEVMSLGFWLRRAQVMQMAQDLPIGAKARGLAFHITPANVDTQFVYSWALSLLCGNTNVVRLSQRRGEVARLLQAIIEKQLAQPAFASLASSNLFIEYDHNSTLTAKLSALCDLRIIWGGDETIKRIQRSPLPADAHEVSFGNKISGALLDAKAILDLDSIQPLVHNFYNDVYWFNQQGCASPRLIFWLGTEDEIAKAKIRIWRFLSDLFISKQTSFSATVTERYAIKQQFSAAFISCPDNIDSIFLRFDIANDIQDVDIPSHTGRGLFYERNIKTIDELAQYLPTHFQTLTTNKLTDSALTSLRENKAILRLVDIGQALAFSHRWDGMNLLEEFCYRN